MLSQSPSRVNALEGRAMRRHLLEFLQRQARECLVLVPRAAWPLDEGMFEILVEWLIAFYCFARQLELPWDSMVGVRVNRGSISSNKQERRGSVLVSALKRSVAYICVTVVLPNGISWLHSAVQRALVSRLDLREGFRRAHLRSSKGVGGNDGAILRRLQRLARVIEVIQDVYRLTRFVNFLLFLHHGKFRSLEERIINHSLYIKDSEPSDVLSAPSDVTNNNRLAPLTESDSNLNRIASAPQPNSSDHQASVQVVQMVVEPALMTQINTSWELLTGFLMHIIPQLDVDVALHTLRKAKWRRWISWPGSSWRQPVGTTENHDGPAEKRAAAHRPREAAWLQQPGYIGCSLCGAVPVVMPCQGDECPCGAVFCFICAWQYYRGLRLARKLPPPSHSSPLRGDVAARHTPSAEPYDTFLLSLGKQGRCGFCNEPLGKVYRFHMKNRAFDPAAVQQPSPIRTATTAVG